MRLSTGRWWWVCLCAQITCSQVGTPEMRSRDQVDTHGMSTRGSWPLMAIPTVALMTNLEFDNKSFTKPYITQGLHPSVSYSNVILCPTYFSWGPKISNKNHESNLLITVPGMGYQTHPN